MIVMRALGSPEVTPSASCASCCRFSASGTATGWVAILAGSSVIAYATAAIPMTAATISSTQKGLPRLGLVVLLLKTISPDCANKNDVSRSGAANCVPRRLRCAGRRSAARERNEGLGLHCLERTLRDHVRGARARVEVHVVGVLLDPVDSGPGGPRAAHRGRLDQLAVGELDRVPAELSLLGLLPRYVRPDRAAHQPALDQQIEPRHDRKHDDQEDPADQR